MKGAREEDHLQAKRRVRREPEREPETAGAVESGCSRSYQSAICQTK